MLAQIRNSFFPQLAKLAALALALMAFASCATKPEPQLVSDPSGARESALPWNKQEKWESTGQLGPMADRFGGGGR